jgi:hypothetical protein
LTGKTARHALNRGVATCVNRSVAMPLFNANTSFKHVVKDVNATPPFEVNATPLFKQRLFTKVAFVKQAASF